MIEVVEQGWVQKRVEEGGHFMYTSKKWKKWVAGGFKSKQRSGCVEGVGVLSRCIEGV